MALILEPSKLRDGRAWHGSDYKTWLIICFSHNWRPQVWDRAILLYERSTCSCWLLRHNREESLWYVDR